VPWPISDRAIRITTVSSGERPPRHLLGRAVGGLRGGEAERDPEAERQPTADRAAPARNERRLTCDKAVIGMPPFRLWRRVDRSRTC